MIQLLGNIPYDLDIFVRNGGAKKVYDIIPLTYWENIKRSKKKGTDLFEYDKEKINEYIGQYSGPLSSEVFYSPWRDNQSKFDFVNIFTEEKSGDLAKWIIDNKMHLLDGSTKNNKYKLQYF